jgi:hypothetical protein
MADHPRFNLRLTPELDQLVIQSARTNRRSKNAEILAALDWRLKPTPALKIAEAIAPMLEKLSPAQLEQLVDIIRTMAPHRRRPSARAPRKPADRRE